MTRLKHLLIVAGAALCLIGLLIAGIVLFTKKGNNAPQYFFDKEPFVHPKIVEDLTSWVSDRGEQVVSINLPESMNTNRYFGEIKRSERNKLFVFYEDTDACLDSPCSDEPPFFGYEFIGRTSSGIIILFTEWSGGGTGRFDKLLLLKTEQEKGVSYDEVKHEFRHDRERLLLKRIAEIELGDRYGGEITLKGDVLHIGKDEGPHASNPINEDIIVRFDQSL